MYHAHFRRSDARTAARSRLPTARSSSRARSCASAKKIASSTRKRIVASREPSHRVRGRQAHSTSHVQFRSSGSRTLATYGPHARRATRSCVRTAPARARACEPHTPLPVRCGPPCAPGLPKVGALDRRARCAGGVTRALVVRCDRRARSGARRDACASRAQVEPRPRPVQRLSGSTAGHARGRRSSDMIAAISSPGSTGLVTWFWKPASIARVRSSRRANAVSAIAGVAPPRSAGSARTDWIR